MRRQRNRHDIRGDPACRMHKACSEEILDSLAGATGASVGKTSNTALEMRVQDLPEGLLDDGLGVGDTTCANRMPRTRGAADGLPNGRAAP